jgi:hypothetical protein
MNKDIIYIDVEDDITAIIGKVKGAKEKVVALVPPKRIGVLQSAVNLRLLARAASQSNKHLVLITSNAALSALAAAAKMPVAKNLQSKPEIAEISALDIDDGEDIIDGAQLPVGELVRTADHSVVSADEAATNLAIEGALRDNAAEESSRALPPAPGRAPVRPKVKSGIKVPNFNSFRKRLMLIIGGGVLLVAFLIWAMFFAAHATVMITARTSDSSANAKVNLDPTAVTDLSTNTLKSTTKQIKKTVSVEFEATGTKDVGNKASGSMKLTRTNPSATPLSVPAGTQFTSAGLTFVSTESATLTTQLTANGVDPGTATVAVQAAGIGDEYNLSGRSYQPSVSGVSATGSDMSGGSHREVQVVTAADVQKAADQLAQENSDAVKKQLASQLGSGVVVVDQTFKTDQSTPQASPAIDQEVASGAKPKLSSDTTYSLSGVAKSEVSSYLDAYFAKQLEGKTDQRVYGNGADQTTFTNVAPSSTGYAATLVATAKVGLKIEDAAVKAAAKGKRYGEIQSTIEAIQGVDSVDVKFSPFWVTKAPNDISKISVEFKLNESK